MNDVADSNPTTATLTDEGIRCPTCGYNLTGLSTRLCPECGDLYDREKLLFELASAPQPIPVWSEGREIGWPRAFIKTLLEIWFHPIRYAVNFPKKPNLEDPVAFSWLCVGCATLFASVSALLLAKNPLHNLLAIPAAIGTQLAIGSIVCERIVAAAVFYPIAEGEVRRGWYQNTLAWMRMTRAFLVLNTLVLLMLLLAETYILGRPLKTESVLVGGILVTIYWWTSIMLSVKARRQSGWNVVIAMMCIPVLYVVGTFYFFVGFLVMRILLS